MGKRIWAGVFGLLILSILGCRIPFSRSGETPTEEVRRAVEQTIVAQQLAGTATNLNQEELVTETAEIKEAQVFRLTSRPASCSK